MNPLDELPTEVAAHLVEHLRLNPGTDTINYPARRPDGRGDSSHAFIRVTRDHAREYAQRTGASSGQ